MEDDTTPIPSGEEPATPESQTPDVDEIPTVVIPPYATEYTTQTMATEVPVDEFATMATMPSTANEATRPLPIDTSAAPTVQAGPQVMPDPAYEQFSAPTDAISPASYPIPSVSEQLQTDDSAILDAHYPAQPGLPLLNQPGAPTPVVKKRRTLLWVVGVIIILLLVGGGTAFAIVASHIPTNTPTQALQQFCHGFTTLNAQEVYDTYSVAAKEKTSLAQLQQVFTTLKSLSNLVKFSNCTASNVQQQDTTAIGTITITSTLSFMGTSISNSEPHPIHLVLEDNTWRIDTSDTATPNFTVPTVPDLPTFPPVFPTSTVSSS